MLFIVKLIPCREFFIQFEVRIPRMFNFGATKYLAPAMLLLLACLPAVSGCLPLAPGVSGAQPDKTTAVRQGREYTYFTMGGIRIKMTGPEGYSAVPSGDGARQAASLTLAPPENIFALFMPSDMPAAAESKLLRDRRFVIVSARPEFMGEYVEMQFFQALRKDLQRVNGSWETDSLEHFKRLTETYYINQDSFSHSLGVFHSTRYSLSIARIVREGGTFGNGAASSYPEETRPEAPETPDQQWFNRYFAGAYHKIVVQNVMLLGGRYFNVYFSAPLAGAYDIQALMEENAAYMNMVASAIRAGEVGPDTATGEANPTSGPRSSGNRQLSGKAEKNAVSKAPI